MKGPKVVTRTILAVYYNKASHTEKKSSMKNMLRFVGERFD